MANIDHQSVVGSNDAGVILRPNVRNQGHLEHISAPFAPTKIAWGQEARCTIPFQEPSGTHGVIDDLYMTFRIGLAQQAQRLLSWWPLMFLPASKAFQSKMRVQSYSKLREEAQWPL